MEALIILGVVGFLIWFVFGVGAEVGKGRAQDERYREHLQREYLALSDTEKLIAKIEENQDVQEIQRLIEIAPLEGVRHSDGVTPIIATVRYVRGGNYQNRSRRFRILGEILRRIPRERHFSALNAVDKKGWTALMHAAANSAPIDGALLVYLGADPVMKNQSGESAADIASKWPSIVPVFEGRDAPPIFAKTLTDWKSDWPGKWP